MENQEKRTFGDFIKANKKKVIAGAIIVGGIVTGVVVATVLQNRGVRLSDAITDIPDELAGGAIETIVEVAA